MSTSKSADNFDFISERDLETLQNIAESGNPGNSDVALRDPVESGTQYSSQNKNLGPVQSRAMVEMSKRMTNAEAAERLGVSGRTVERHRAHWLDFDDQDAVKLELTTRIDDRLCAAMRCACQDGETLAAVAEYFDISRGAAYNHVSANADFECSHDPPVEVERVEFIHGGMRGNPDRRVCDDCGRFTGRMGGHEC